MAVSEETGGGYGVNMRVYISAPADQNLSDRQLKVKKHLLSLLKGHGVEPQEFGVSGLSELMPWTADNSIQVMRQCEGAVVLGFTRFRFTTEWGYELSLPTEYNHFEGALAIALGLPTFLLAEQETLGRCIFSPMLGVPLFVTPAVDDTTWLLEAQFQSFFRSWLASLQRRRWFHSCFISYSSKDEPFCQVLYSRLQQAGIHVWYAPQDMRGGRKIHEEVRRAIKQSDKLLLVLTAQSLKSAWVEHEIRTARKREVAESRRILFPIRLVDYPALESWECFDADTKKDLASEIREYYIPDFAEWQKREKFEEVFQRLLRDLEQAGEEK